LRNLEEAAMKNVTIYDIADALGVNPSTVNRALNGKKGVGEALRTRIVAYAEEAGYRINPAAKSLNRRLRIGLVMQHTVIAFERQILTGVEAAYTELQTINVALESHIVSTEREYLQACVALCEAGCDAALLFPIRQEAMKEICRLFEEAGIPVGTVVSDVSAKRLFSVHLDGETSGRVAAELLFRFTNCARVAVFTGDRDIPIHTELLDGFESFAQDRFDITSVYSDAADPDAARRNIKEMLKVHSDIGGIFVSTANSAPICEEVATSGRRIAIVAMDVFAETAEYLRRGVISALLYQQPRDQGYIALWNMVKFLDGYMAPQDVIVQPQVVMQSNIDAFWHV
jgi:LacI family transcriptional regulator